MLVTKHAKLPIFIFMAGASCLIASIDAIACRLAHLDVKKETIDATWVIFRGSILSYEIIDGQYAKVVFRTRETYRGEARQAWKVAWQNSTFELPKNISEFKEQFGDDTVVGLHKPENSGPTEMWTLPLVMQSACRPSFMVRWHARNPFPKLFSELVERGVIPQDN